MSVLVKPVPPAFSAVFVSSGTHPVSSIVTPTPYDDSLDDAFARPSEDRSSRQLSLRLIGDGELPRIELAALRKRFEFARGARGSGDLEGAFTHYRESLAVLESPFDAVEDSAPLYCHLPEGPALLKESLFEAAVLSAPGDSPAMLNRLSRFIETAGGSPADIAQAKLLKAYLIMQHTNSASQPKGALLKEAYKLVQGVRYDIDASDDLDTPFYAGLLSIELLARSIAMAHNRHDYEERNLLIERQREIIKEVLSDHLTEERRESIATYIADSALLLARLGLWSPALERARTATARGLVSTAGAKRLLTDPLFDPFVDGARILSAAEIKFRSKKGSFMRRLQAALALAHSKGLKESLFVGLFGLTAGFGASVLLGMRGEAAVVSSIAGAALFAVLNRLRNGWGTLEARYAAETGVYDRTAAKTAHDASRLVLWGGINAATWLVPAAILNSGVESASVFTETLSRAGDLYLDLGASAFDQIVLSAKSSMATLETLSPADAGQVAYQAFIAASAALAASSLLNKDIRESLGKLSLLFIPGTALLAAEATKFIVGQPLEMSMDRMYDLYITASAAFFLTSLFSPSSRNHISKLAPLFVPGALGLSAEIGMGLLGQDPGPYPEILTDPIYRDRILRASIISAEMMLLQFTTGLIPLRHGAKVMETFRSAANAMDPIRSPHNFMLPITGAIVGAGLMSPLGGMMQEGMNVRGFSNHLIQGVAISLGLLPLTLGISGVLKQFIPSTTRIREAWEDTRGLPLPRALLEMSRGYFGSFDVPYVKNRLLRNFTMDLPAAAFRATLGWDTNMGQGITSSMNLVSGNAMATSTWPEASATVWERRAIDHQIGRLALEIESTDARLRSGKISAKDAEALRAEAMDTTYDFLTKAGQVAHFLHPFMAHRSLSDRLWPLYAVTRSIKKPTYPQMPNVDFYANLQQMLSDSNADDLSAEGLEALLGFVEHYARDPENYELLRPLVKTLALSRNSEHHGERIEGFFGDNPWITDVLNIDPDKYKPGEERTRRVTRSKVKRRIRKRFRKYEQRVASHGRQSALKEQFDGLFVADGELLGDAGT